MADTFWDQASLGGVEVVVAGERSESYSDDASVVVVDVVADGDAAVVVVVVVTVGVGT